MNNRSFGRKCDVNASDDDSIDADRIYVCSMTETYGILNISVKGLDSFQIKL